MEKAGLIKSVLQNKKSLVYYTVSLLVVFGLVVGGYKLMSLYLSYKKVVLNPTSGTHIILGTSNSDSPAVDNILIQADTKTSKRIKNGYYFVKYGGDGYENLVDSVNVNKSIVLTTPLLSYSRARLTQLLSTERSSAQKAIKIKLPDSNYSIKSEKLYQQGQWYGAVMAPNNHTQDNLLVIAKKENNNWLVVAGPTIIFTLSDYPNIPQQVIKDMNRTAYIN